MRIIAGDFIHPTYFKTLKEKLIPQGNGLFLHRDALPDNQVYFMLSAEVSNIFKQAGKTRKVHSLIFVPTFEAAEKVISALNKMGNIHSDGRPIFGFSVQTLLKILLEASPEAVLIPAHIWTPWFSMFGSKSGFDSIQECFGDYASLIFAVETGLSSDSKMNWQISALDSVALISNSDAHSLGHTRGWG